MLGFGMFTFVVLEAILVKWLFVGRYKAGIYPLFGRTHLSHWASYTLVGWALKAFHNTIFEVWILAALGANVGQEATLH